MSLSQKLTEAKINGMESKIKGMEANMEIIGAQQY